MKKKLSLRFYITLPYLVIAVIPIIFQYYLATRLAPGLPPHFQSLVRDYGLIIWLSGGFIVFWLITGKIAKDIRHSIESVEKVRRGDLTVQANLKARGEVKELNNSFNLVVQQFHEMIANVYLSIEEVKHLTDTVSSTAAHTAQASNQISVSAEGVAKGAGSQADDSEACAKIAGELIAGLEMVSDAAKVMEEKAETANQLTEFGRENVAELLEKSNSSERTIQEITQRIGDLNEKAKNIGQITSVINGIARQTNLLSLNAAIEASRAGEAGRGFAVVAGEIKKLAEQSLRFNEEIVAIISGIQEQVDQTAAAVNATLGTLSSQLESVRKTNDAFQKIATSTQELHQQLNVVRAGINELSDQKGQLSESIVNIAAVAQETAASTEEMASLMYSQSNSGEVLVQLSGNLDQLITNLDQKVTSFQFNKIQLVKKSVAVIACVDIPFFDDTYAGARDIGAKLGFDVHCTAPKNYNAREQAELIEEAIRQKVFGIGISPIDGPEVRAAIKKALANEIKIICFDSDLPGSGRHGFIGTDNVKAGNMMGEIVAKTLNGKGAVIGNSFSKKLLNLKQRIDGFAEVIQKYPEIKILAIDSPENSDLDIRWRSLKETLNQNSQCDCFVCFESQGHNLAKLIKDELKINLKVVSFDKTTESLQAVRNEYVTSIIAQRQGLWGELVVRKLNDLMLGKNIADFEDTGTYEINKGNISVF